MSFFIAFLLSVTCYGESSTTANSPDLVVHLLDYLAKDYGGAVQNGKVVSEFEYAEQVEFAGIVEKNSAGVGALNSDPNFVAGIEKLQILISGKGSADEVAKLARVLQQEAIRLAKIEVAPTAWPSLVKGAELFRSNCVTCHGANGLGDGPAGRGLDPAPSNFHDPDLVWNSAPYKFYNTIRLGVPGTGMVPFAHLTDDEVWSLAFYLKALPYGGKPQKKGQTVRLKDAAMMTDAEIAEGMGGKNDDVIAVIGSLRAGFTGPSDSDSLRAAADLLNESVAAARNNDFDSANRLALQAYLEGIEPMEPKMKANMPGFVPEIEAMMGRYREAVNAKSSAQELEEIKAGIVEKLNFARTTLAANKMSSAVAFGATFSIFLREGFEAVLIIVVLLSILRAMGQAQASKWVHLGWGAAVTVGIVTWFASGVLLAMSGMGRELLEGMVALVAVLVLVYVGFFLHRYSEIKKWHAYLQTKLKNGLDKKSYLALTLVAFMAVFREAFEVVLFLRAIWMDLDVVGQQYAGMGILSSLMLLAGLSVVAIRQSRKLPIGMLFQICSWTMIVLAVVLAGKGIHSLQEAGLVPISVLSLPIHFDLVGIYPSVQTLAVQVSVVMLFGALLMAERRAAAKAI